MFAPARRCRFRAVAKDHHSEVVSRWIDELVIGQGFCPWAGPAQSAGRIRVVSSGAVSEGGVLEDLLSEARQLPCGDKPEKGPTTVVLVCPKVAAWQAGWKGFQRFANFFELRLLGGQAGELHSDFEAWVKSEGVRAGS
eukprot:Skav225655  [mRNA]  locus=scaffold4659:92889:96216:- [translate_table: standard]